MASLRDDDVRIALGRFYELKVHGLYRLAVMVYGHLDVPSTLCHVTDDDSHKAVVVVRIHEYLDVHLVPEFLACEDQDAFHDDHVSGLHCDSLCLGTGAGDVGIDRLLDGLSRLELTDLLA